MQSVLLAQFFKSTITKPKQMKTLFRRVKIRNLPHMNIMVILNYRWWYELELNAVQAVLEPHSLRKSESV